MARAWLIDIAPLRRHRDFRLLWCGQLVTMVGSLITAVAVPFQVYGLTHSSFVVGAVGAAEIVPVLLLALLGGALADRVDRRLMVVGAQVAQAAASLALGVNAWRDHPSVWVIVACGIVATGAYALERPSLDALMPRLVEPAELAAAGALTSVLYEAGSLVGPVGAGLLIAHLGLPAAFALDAVTFAVSCATLLLIAAKPPPPDAPPVSLRAIREGLAFARSRPVLLGTYVTDMAAMFFGIPTALLPQLAARHGGAETLGLLVAAPAVGGLAVTLTSGWTAAVRRRGRAIVLAAIAYGVAVALAGVGTALVAILACLALAGAADSVSGLFRMRIWNETVPDAMRGRLAGIEMLSWSSGPTLGQLESGTAGALVGLRPAIVSGGLLAIVGVGACAAALPEFWRDEAVSGESRSEERA